MPDNDDQVREVQQAGAEPSWFATGVGLARQLIIDITSYRPHIMDGVNAGGKTLAFESELLTKVTSLSQELIDHVLTVLGIYQALEELITENGGTVSTSLSTNGVQTMSAEPEDPWADLE